MPINFTPNLTPTFPVNSFGSEKEHVKQIYTVLNSGTAFVSPLATLLSTLITRIDLLTTQLETDYNVAEGDKPTLESYTVIPIDPDTGQQEVDPDTGELVTNLPIGWAAALFTASDFTSIISSIGSYQTANQLIRTNLAILKTFITTADDTFKLHNDLLSGVREDPPPANVKPTQRSLLSLVSAIQTLENKNGVTFTNYLPLLFGTLFTGDTTIANAQAFLNTDPIPTTYASLDILVGVQADPYLDTPSVVAASINSLLSGSTYDTTILTHRDNFNIHILNDTAQYNTVVDKLDRAVQALTISSAISDEYTKFMYTKVFGSSDINTIINNKDNGRIS